jgi:hypothetical protein
MDDIFLTFDMDWACDEVINHTIDILEKSGARATFFMTNDTPVLERIRSNKLIEAGIHPNFNKALSCAERKPFTQIIDEILRVVPEALSERAHALTHNSLISFELKKRGILYESNMYIPLSANMQRHPFFAPSGLVTVPFFFADDIYFFHQSDSFSADEYLKTGGLKVFDFHPIHIFTNAASLNTYEKAKTVYHKPDELRELRNEKLYGASDFLSDVIRLGKKNSLVFKTISEIGVNCI